MVVAYQCGGPLCDRALRFVVPRDASLLAASPLDFRKQQMLAKVVLALLPALAWCVAALRGSRSCEQSGVARCCAYTAVIATIAFSATIRDMLWWRSQFLDTHAQLIHPYVTLSSLDDYWWSGLRISLAAAVVLAVWILARPSRPRQKGRDLR